MSDTNITKSIEVTAVPKVYTSENGQSYQYFAYYANIDGVSVRLKLSKDDYSGKQVMKNYFVK